MMGRGLDGGRRVCALCGVYILYIYMLCFATDHAARLSARGRAPMAHSMEPINTILDCIALHITVKTKIARRLLRIKRVCAALHFIIGMDSPLAFVMYRIIGNIRERVNTIMVTNKFEENKNKQNYLEYFTSRRGCIILWCQLVEKHSMLITTITMANENCESPPLVLRMRKTNFGRTQQQIEKKKCSSREAINNQAESLARSRSLLLCLSARHFYICFALINIVVCIDVKIISATTTEH